MQNEQLNLYKTEESSDTVLRIYQTPVQQLPEDLYIPPQAFSIWLDQFSGPLDLLLYLVKKNNVDLTRMQILPITEQYLAYISELDTVHFELAGDYLLMASTLMAIKTELLLPKAHIPVDERDPKAELVERLSDYAQIKTASQRLDNLIRLERDVFLAMVSFPDTDVMNAELPSYSPNLLITSLLNMQLQTDYHMHTIKTDTVPLSERIVSISHQLSSEGTRSFHQLLDKSQGKVGIVVSFIAILELIKRQLIGIVINPSTASAISDLPKIQQDNHALTLQWRAF